MEMVKVYYVLQTLELAIKALSQANGKFCHLSPQFHARVFAKNVPVNFHECEWLPTFVEFHGYTCV